MKIVSTAATGCGVTAGVTDGRGPRGNKGKGRSKDEREPVRRVGSSGAWDAYLARHPTGFYADLARAQRDQLAEPKGDSPTGIMRKFNTGFESSAISECRLQQ